MNYRMLVIVRLVTLARKGVLLLLQGRGLYLRL